MTAKDKTEIVQEICKFLDKNKDYTSYQMATLILKEIIEPYLDIEKAVYERMLFSHMGHRNKGH